jgi:hypothetical protein
MLMDALPPLVGQPIREPSIYPARGYWTHKHQDVMAWQGHVDVPVDMHRFSYSLGSWDTMTACVRRGFEVQDCRGDDRRYVDFEIHAKEKR